MPEKSLNKIKKMIKDQYKTASEDYGFVIDGNCPDLFYD